MILQERDRKIMRTQTELSGIEPQRQAMLSRAAGTQSVHDAAKLKAKQIESDRKKLELEVEANKQKIEKYSLQQFQTKKNEEYRALAHEIETCKAEIIKLDDEQIVLMEQIEAAQKETLAASVLASQTSKQLEDQKASLANKEVRLKKELDEL